MQRSVDGQNWIPIGRVAASGQSEEAVDYQFIDQWPNAGNNYYRLRQVDFDGREDYSEVILITIPFDQLAVQVFPNPTTGDLNVFVFNEEQAELELKIMDITGQTVRLIEQDAWNDGDNRLALRLHDLNAGMYFLVASSSTGERQVIPFVKN